MKKMTVNIATIVFVSASLIVLNQIDLLEKAAPFMLVPILVFYYFGQYVERRFSKQVNEKESKLSNK